MEKKSLATAYAISKRTKFRNSLGDGAAPVKAPQKEIPDEKALGIAHKIMMKRAAQKLAAGGEIMDEMPEVSEDEGILPMSESDPKQKRKAMISGILKKRHG